ncbi:hypothetical protein EON65_09725 [archaeon]|nr:MAG: hypothetical protein EON65_09725 [archaeon]
MVKESLKGVVALGKTAPLVGPVVGAVLQFWQCYETMGAAAADFQQLQKQVDLATDWLVLAAPLLTSRGMSAVLLKEIQGLCAAVQHATQLVEAIGRRVGQEKSAVNSLYNFVLSSEDKATIEQCRDELYKAVESFKSSFPAEERLRNMADTCSKLFKLLDEPILFDATIQLKLRECMAGSREWLHEEVGRWLDQDNSSGAAAGGKKDPKRSKIFWFQASAGMGKTVFATSLVDRLKHYASLAGAITNEGKTAEVQEENRLLGAVFFNFTDAKASQPITVVKSLIYQVARALPEIQVSILAAAEQVMSSAEKDNVSSLFSLLLCAPLEEYANGSKASSNMKPMVLVLDALDEAGVVHSQERQQLLSFLSRKAVRELPSWVRIFITGRPEPDILQALGPFAHSIEEGERMKQHQQDLFQYISYHVQPYMVNEQECQKVSQTMLDKSESKFVYVAMVAEEVESYFLDKDFQSLTADEVIQEVEALPQGLDECYAKYMKKVMLARKNAIKEAVSSDSAYDSILHAFLSVEVSAYEVISVADMQWLLDISDHEMKLLAQSVQAVFPVQDGKFVPFHKSIIDWLTDSDHSHNFFVSKHEGHALVAERCLKAKLGVNLSLMRAEQTGWANMDPRLVQRMLASQTPQSGSQFVSYMARFLLDHLDNCEKSLSYHVVTYSLLTDLWWMLVVLKYTDLSTLIESYRVHHMDEQWSADREDHRKDVKLLLRCLKHMDGSHYSYPAGPLSELCTQLEGRLRQIKDKSVRVAQLVADALQYLKEHRGWRVMTNSLTIPAGKLEFSASVSSTPTMCLLPRSRVALGFDRSIEVRNYATAQVEYTLQVSSIPYQLCFLPPNYLAYLFHSSPEIAVMNCMTGEIEYTLPGQGRNTHFLSAFSNSSLVSGSDDGTICIWSLNKHGVLENSFSLSGHKLVGMCASDHHQTVLAAYSYNGLYCWDLTGNCQKVIREVCDKVFCHIDYVATINCVSMNSYAVQVYKQSTWEKVFQLSHVACNDCKASTACITNECLAISAESNINVYSLLNGDLLAELSGHLDYVTMLLSLDDSRLASTSFDFTIRVWNLQENDSASRIEGGKNIWAATKLDSDLFALVFNTKKIELWCPTQGQLVDVLLVDGCAHNIKALSADLFVVHISDIFFQIWNFRSKTSYSKQAVPISESTIQESDTQEEIGIRIVEPIVDTGLLVIVPQFLFDIFLFNFHTMLWDKPLVGHKESIRSVAVINGYTIASCADDLNMIIWDLSTQTPLNQVAFELSPTQLYFFPHRNLLCAVLVDSDIVLYDTDKQQEVFRSESRQPPRSITTVIANDRHLYGANKDAEDSFSIDLDSFILYEQVAYTPNPPLVGELKQYYGSGVTYLDNSLYRFIKCNEESSVYLFTTYNLVLHCVKKESL